MKERFESLKFSKADAITAALIAILLPTYYKLQYILDGELAWRNFIHLGSWAEYLFSALLGIGLIQIDHLSRGQGRVQLLIVALASAGAAAAFTWFYYTVVFPHSAPGSFLFDIALLALATPLLISGVRDRIVLTRRVADERFRASEAEREALAARYEVLKTRLSPHFLFNGFNTLADIVEDDPTLAVRFIDSMAAVYRYLIVHQDAERAPLREELEAVKALLFVLQTRHPGALDAVIPAPLETEGVEIVPLTLQTLLENALKHNAYSPQTPLTIRIRIEADDLVVENSVNPKGDVVSFKTGLRNLRHRTSLVTDRPLRFGQRAGFFWARAPLLKVETR